MFCSESRPAAVTCVERPHLSIQKTFCIQIQPCSSTSVQMPPNFKNFLFADRCRQPQLAFKGVAVETLVVTNKAWKQGYYTKKGWDPKAPENWSRFMMRDRFEEQEAFDVLTDGDVPAPWGRKAMANVKTSFFFAVAHCWLGAGCSSRPTEPPFWSPNPRWLRVGTALAPRWHRGLMSTHGLPCRGVSSTGGFTAVALACVGSALAPRWHFPWMVSFLARLVWIRFVWRVRPSRCKPKL